MLKQPNGEYGRALCFGHPPDVDEVACAALVSPRRLGEQHVGIRFGDHVTSMQGRIPAFVGGAIDPYVFEAWLGDGGWIAKFARNDNGGRFLCYQADLASAVPTDVCTGVRSIWERGAVRLMPHHPSVPR